MDRWQEPPDLLVYKGFLAKPDVQKISGEGGIRTLVTVAGKSVFETDAFNHSATSPGGSDIISSGPVTEKRPSRVLDMDICHIIDYLSLPEAYPDPVDRVVVLQTHISVVFLAGTFAYKVKKPVALGFLDFSTLERRFHFCHEEVRLNRRLAPHIYLGVVPSTRVDSRLMIEGTGETVEWAVKMVRLPDEASLLDRLRRHLVTTSDMISLARFLADFHQHAEHSPLIAAFGRFEVVAGNARENYAQAESQVGCTISRAVLDRLSSLTEETLDRLRPLLEDRALRGVPRDTHGDLHLDHIYYDPSRPSPDNLFAIDCIEFNERFRYADPIADIAFLLMDLQFHQRYDLASVLTTAYLSAAGDTEGEQLLPFYIAYRAAVRAKVEGLELLETEVPAVEREAALRRARAHWLLALGQLEEASQRPALLLVGGLSGTGKSTLARALAESAGFQIIRSDVIRKTLAGLDAESPGGPELYTTEWNERTYEECRRLAQRAIFEGQRVIVDATFRHESSRQAFLDLAHSWCVPVILLMCEANSEVVRARLAGRTGDASDATWDVYTRQQATWEPPSPGTAAALVTISTNPGCNPTQKALQTLRDRKLL